MRLFRHPRWQHLDYRVKVATTQENKPPTQGTCQWTFTTPRWRCGSILLPSLNAGVPEPTGESQGANYQYSNIGSDNGLAPSRRRAGDKSLSEPMVVSLLTHTSNGSWCMGIKGEMSGTVCVTFTWYMYIYELFIAFVCFVVCSLL